MATAQQRARARADRENGKKVVLHSTKLGPKQRERLRTATTETAMVLRDHLRKLKACKGHEVIHYPLDEVTHTIYIRGRGLSHTLYMDCRKQTLTLYEDTRSMGRVVVARDVPQLEVAVSSILQ